MLKRLQAATGLLVALFVLVHLVNTWLAALGPGAYDGVQRLLRVAYQFAPLEALLLAAIATHAGIGIARIVREPKRTLTARARWHRYAGFFLLLVIGGHVLAVRGASWFYDVYPGFAGLAFSLAALPGYFYPYYFLLALAGLYHALNGLGLAARVLGWQITLPTAQLKALTGLGAALTAVALLGLGGILTDAGNPYGSDFAALVTEITGVSFAP